MTEEPDPGQEVEIKAASQPLSVIVERRLEDFAKVLPSHLQPDLFVRVAVAELRRTDYGGGRLQQAARQNPESLLRALLECATLGHVPGKAGDNCFALVPRFGKAPQVIGIEQYQGEIQRMYRAGGVRSIHCDAVRENDYFELPKLHRGEKIPVHEYSALATEEERGQLVGAWAIAELESGAWSRTSWVNAEEVAKHRAAAGSNNAIFWEGDWMKAMWMKTAVHGLTTWVPTSREYQQDRIQAQIKVEEIRRQADVVDGEVV